MGDKGGRGRGGSAPVGGMSRFGTVMEAARGSVARLAPGAEDVSHEAMELSCEAGEDVRRGRALTDDARGAARDASAFVEGLGADDDEAAHEEAGAREIEADGHMDAVEEASEPERERQVMAEDEESATAVARVCRNGWNTLDTRAVGGHWFSA